MLPRLPNSKKWTALPPELIQQIREVFTEGFAEKIKNGEILVDGRIYPNELLLRVGYLETGRLAQANFEVSLDFNMAKQNAVEQIHFAIDCAASMMEEYFQGEGTLSDFPRHWQPFQISGRQVYLQVSTENQRLEAEADKILGLTNSGLVQGADEDEDREAVRQMLGIADTAADEDAAELEDNDSGEPQKH